MPRTITVALLQADLESARHFPQRLAVPGASASRLAGLGRQGGSDDKACARVGDRPHEGPGLRPEFRHGTAGKLPATLCWRNTAHPFEAATRPRDSAALLRAIRRVAFRGGTDTALVGRASYPRSGRGCLATQASQCVSPGAEIAPAGSCSTRRLCP